MNEMVERVARAIYETEPFGTAHGHAMPWSAVAESQKEGFRLKARDAIRAMREPSQAMFLAAEKSGVSFSTQQRCWPVMIDAALDKE